MSLKTDLEKLINEKKDLTFTKHELLLLLISAYKKGIEDCKKLELDY